MCHASVVRQNLLCSPLAGPWACGQLGQRRLMLHANLSVHVSVPEASFSFKQGPVLSIPKRFFSSITQFHLPTHRLKLHLAKQSMPAIFTDNSHQSIWFPLPQTVTFIETSWQMSDLQTTRRSSSQDLTLSIGLDRYVVIGEHPL